MRDVQEGGNCGLVDPSRYNQHFGFCLGFISISLVVPGQKA